MPIKDFNGTTANEIGKVFDYNGTTATQIGKVFDWNGTAKSEIYSAQSPSTPLMLNNADQATETTGGWTMSNKGGGVYLGGYYDSVDGWPAGWYMSFSEVSRDGQGWMCTNNLVEISGWNKLALTFFHVPGYGVADPGNGYVYIALTTSKDYAGGSWGYETMNGTNIVKSAVVLTSNQGTSTLELDVSGIEGTYYVQIGRWNKASKATYTTAFQKLVFS